MSPTRDPRGQVLIISAFAMALLIAIAAIVVDLGFSWMLRRQEQNAADPGSLAAAKWIRDETDATLRQQKMEAEACFFAQENGFFRGDANCAAAFAAGDLDVNYPPATTLAGQFQGHFGYVEVIIEADHPSFFGQFFGEPFATVRTAAVAALTLGDSNGSSLVALGGSCQPPDDGDSTVTGGGTLNIFPASGVTAPGGYINVNAPCGGIGDPHACDGNGNSSALAVTGGATVIAPHAFVVGGCGTGGGGTFTCQSTAPCLTEENVPLGDPLAGLLEPWPLVNLPAPDCPNPADVNSPTDRFPCDLTKSDCPQIGSDWICSMDPGVYYAGWDIGPDVKIELGPGMYAFAGGGIKMNAGASMESVYGVDAGGAVIDARVTIFSTDYTTGCAAGIASFCQGPIEIRSNGPLRILGTDATTCQQVSPAICPWTGILMWQDGTTIGTPRDITINGQSDLNMSGTIYAPESKVTINGGNATSGCTPVVGQDLFCLAIQIIARQWEISGQAVIDMPYDPEQLYQLEQRGLVH